ncbi:MAG: hypothetical protein DSY37_00945 [Hyperthermus sp.]|nr:MAG: hypothetical protein DSY37_00945 [Hyperthermus sp.]
MDLILVLDTTAFIAKLPLYSPPIGVKQYTTSLVIEEVKDRESLEALNTITELGRVSVTDPSPSYVERVREEAKRLKMLRKLSSTDISVVALALELKERGQGGGGEVVLVTDDYAVQALASHLGLKFQPIRTRGISLQEGKRLA